MSNEKVNTSLLHYIFIASKYQTPHFVTISSLRGGTRHLRAHHDHRLAAPHRGLAPRLPPLRGQGGPGVRESCHLQVTSRNNFRVRYLCSPVTEPQQL